MRTSPGRNSHGSSLLFSSLTRGSALAATPASLPNPLPQPSTSAGLLTGYTGSKSAVRIPDGVTGVAEGVFAGRPIQSVEIPASVHHIDTGAFADTPNLKKVSFVDPEHSQLTDIGAEKLLLEPPLWRSCCFRIL